MNRMISAKTIARWVLVGLATLEFCSTTNLFAQDSVQEFVGLPGQSVVGTAVGRVADSVIQLETIGGADQVSGIRVTNHARTATIVSDEGFVVTAAINLAHRPTTILARFPDGQRLPAEVVATNHARQVTLLKVTADKQLPSVNYVSRSLLSVGQTTIAVGRSIDIDQPNVSTGIISAVNRIWGKAIQTDAAISPHNFGGPLVDLEGNVIGILVPMSPQGDGVADGIEWYDSGIGFAVPLDELKLEEMIEGVDLHAGLPGVSFKKDQGYASPAVISACPPNSPAAIAGLKPGDEIVQIDDQPVQLVNQVRHIIGPRYAGDQIKVKFQRDGESLDAVVKLVEKIEPWRHAMLGATLRPKTGSLVFEILITDGPAELAGIKPGDVLTRFADDQAPSIDSLLANLMTMQAGSKISIGISRGGKPIDLDLSLAPLSAEPLETELLLRAKPSELVAVKVAEHSNVCHGYFPEPSDSSGPASILLWLNEPGKFDVSQELQKWQQWCDATNTILLLPESTDSKRWEPGEIEFLNKVALQARQLSDVDPLRVAVGGVGSGGTMASLVAMSERDSWPGVVLLNSAFSNRVSKVQSEPANRLMILMLDHDADDRVSADMSNSTNSLRERGFPVHLESSTKQVERLIMNWVGSLDRL